MSPWRRHLPPFVAEHQMTRIVVVRLAGRRSAGRDRYFSNGSRKSPSSIESHTLVIVAIAESP